MKKEAGLWIDHRKAVIVTVTEDGLETKQIQSNLDKHVRFSSGSSEDGEAEDMQDRQFVNRLNSFYDEVIAAIRDVESILIIGPGEAKGELVKRLERDEIGGRIVGLETVDKMTDRQIAERVRQQFHVRKNASRR
jgi:stalled ribosome rescue protein Dom34